MYTATLVHVETGVEYYKEGELQPFNPTDNQKLLWAILGLPEGITMDVQTFETEIDEFVGYTKKEIQAKVDENFKQGMYNFLPAIGVNQSVILRYGK